MHLSEPLLDQASGLRRMRAARPVKVIAVTGGKGGVGKTNVSVNLAASLSRMGSKVMLFDADLGLANVDVQLGLSPQRNLSHVIAGESTLSDILVEAPGGFTIVPASSGTQRMAELSADEHASLIRCFSDIEDSVDVLIVDTAAGISESVVNFVRACRELIIVACDEPSSITDAYALIKVLNRHGVEGFHMVANRVRSQREGHMLYHKLAIATERFLNLRLDFLGSIPEDERLRRAVQKQQPVVMVYPNSPSARAFGELAKRIGSWPAPSGAASDLEFFVERLIEYSIVHGEMAG
ncbi:flagellar synthesis regulator FleN [Halorhodospira halochloris]|uniref:Flagellar synthesis regulator FleN n=1 Tax=Halorhodospira halochloris TaxID=1052 RepID=A0A0X8XBY2_HALHR|nr:MinD/ParA family protein [Halorhodospira halochloris]MCG5548252.1 MinD/ParA family protein [Halorhodospira halochloris]BAU58833.1 flagellar synthesis regulator FleN [Halorhodospira halochloris]